MKKWFANKRVRSNMCLKSQIYKRKPEQNFSSSLNNQATANICSNDNKDFKNVYNKNNDQHNKKINFAVISTLIN